MNRPVILAICGKSASGKDTTARWLLNYFNRNNIPAHLIVSDTTRPPRKGEENTVDYYFLNPEDFELLLCEDEYLEYTKFRKWYYGTHYSEIEPDKINIGIFNPEGLKKLANFKYEYNIIPIYLKDKMIDRLYRSHNREGQWKLEFFRRIFADWFSFLNIQDILNLYHRSLTITNKDSVIKKSKIIIRRLTHWGIIAAG